MIQDNQQEVISANDKQFKPNFFDLLSFATETTYNLEPKYRHPATDNLPTLAATPIENAGSHFDDMAEIFLDEVFDYDSKLNRKDWEELTAKK